ncbi:Paired amphipathic helix protein Sin3-like 2 [Sesamum angolense]|uniref:Paired amphipathic helix protein Sin3-like 2 n=1 Tax=Sesamum angolense TaxID=2727404 RepID=A0AAE1XDS9_9LAMI|nr:Paired amphipathic helix protein Sin3-like 2 [Sesamum angolense]
MSSCPSHSSHHLIITKPAAHFPCSSPHSKKGGAQLVNDTHLSGNKMREYDQLQAVWFAAGMAAFIACIERAVVESLFTHWRVWAFLALNLLLLAILFTSKSQIPANEIDEETDGDLEFDSKKRIRLQSRPVISVNDGSENVKLLNSGECPEYERSNVEDDGKEEAQEQLSKEELNQRVEAFITMFRQHLVSDAKDEVILFYREKTSPRHEALRDDVYVNPQFKRPFGPSSRGIANWVKLLCSLGLLRYGPPNPPAGGGGGGGGGSLNGVGGSGSGTGVAAGGKNDRFLDVMKDFKAQRIDTAGVIARVKELFKGHPNLILGFNTFLPKGYEITLTDEEEAPPKRTVEFEEAISFVNKIKVEFLSLKRFEHDDHVYKSFLDILNMYRKEHKGITEVYQEVAALFDDQPDLLDEFTRFLPDTSATVSGPHASFGRHSFHRYDEKSSVMPMMRQSLMDKQRLRRDRTIGPNGERDLSVERHDMDDDKTVVKLHKEQKKHIEKENRDKRNRDQDDRDPETENNGEFSMHRLSDKRKSARKVEDFGGNLNLASCDDKDASKRQVHFLIRIKFGGNLFLLSGSYGGVFQVADLLGKYPDLMDGFNDFLERYGFLAGVMGKRNSSKALRIEDKDKEQKREVEGGKEKDRYNLKYWGKSIQELDLSNCQRCSPQLSASSRRSSQRSELGAQVLNDHWVSVTSGSEDYSFKHMRRNQYEESLFRCEDDRFELDMLLESVGSTAKRAEELLNSINNNSIGSDSAIRVEDHFTALVAEIKEIKEKRQREDDVLLSISAGSRHSIIPDIEFEYSDNEIHEDVYKIIKYSCEEVCSTKEQLNKVLRFWTTFLEPMLGVHSRPCGSEASEDNGASKDRMGTTTMKSIVENEGSVNVDATATGLKQPKSNCNGDSTTSSERVNFSIIGFTNADASAKGLTVAPGERSTSSVIAVTSGSDSNHVQGRGANSSRMNNGHIEESIGAKPVTDDRLSSEVAETLRVNQLANGEVAEGSRLTGCNEDSVGPCKNEKEEGELSPNGDFEDNFDAYQDGSSQALSKKNRGSHEEVRPDAAGENDVDADDEDSENGSEAGEDVSGSESAADECSREEHEEEEDGEHDLDGKAESEGEAENTSEAHIGVDGASVPQSDCFLLTCKPLSKHVASLSVHDEKRDRRVFYGNDTFYVLFRLHQTLYERILSAKVNSVSGESKWRTTKDPSSDSYASSKLFQAMKWTISFFNCMNMRVPEGRRSMSIQFITKMSMSFCMMRTYTGLNVNMRMYTNLDESTALCMATEKVLIMNDLICPRHRGLLHSSGTETGKQVAWKTVTQGATVSSVSGSISMI